MGQAHTPGPWFVSGARFKMNGGEWHSVNRYDESKKTDENISCVGYDPRTGAGLADARLIAAAPDLLKALVSAKAAIGRWISDDAGDDLILAFEEVESALSAARATGGTE